MGKTLVTGATGFTGKYLCRRLAEDGEKVVAFVRETSVTDEIRGMGVECRQVDIRDRKEVLENFEDIERVYHLAAAYRTEHSDRDEFTLINVEGTRNVLDGAKASGVKRFIHCSTVGVQGEIETPPAAEEYRCKPGDHYQASKLEGERLARQYFASGLPGVVVRPVGIYGPGDTRFLKLFRPIQGRYFVMIGSGNVLYHMTYIEDLIEGICLAGSRPDVEGEVFTIAGEQYTTLRELVNLIADALGKPRPNLRVPFYPVYIASVLCDKVMRPMGLNPPLFPRRVEFFHLNRAFTIEKARRSLGYEPKVDLREGISRTISWYRNMGLI